MIKFDKLLDEPNWKDRAAELQQQVERVNHYADMLCAEYRHGSYFHRIGLDIKAAIKGVDDE